MAIMRPFLFLAALAVICSCSWMHTEARVLTGEINTKNVSIYLKKHLLLICISINFNQIILGLIHLMFICPIGVGLLGLLKLGIKMFRRLFCEKADLFYHTVLILLGMVAKRYICVM